MKTKQAARYGVRFLRGTTDQARIGVASVAIACMVYTGNAVAQFTDAPAAQSWTTLLGTSTAGSETGIYEYNKLVGVAIPVILLITILWAGLAITRRVIRSFRGS